jgi:hypothetical protein
MPLGDQLAVEREQRGSARSGRAIHRQYHAGQSPTARRYEVTG